MQKISSSTTTANGAGEFTQGQPGSGVDATMITVAWLNAIQRELVNLVVGSGQTLTPTDDGQVLKAVKVLQELASTWDKVTGKPTTRDGYKLSDVFTKTETGTAIQNAVAALVASSPAALDTLKKLADALGNDPNFATTILNALGLKADKATSLLVGSTSRQRPVLAGTVAAGSDGGSDGKGGAIEIREINEVGGGQTDLLWAPSILFNWSGKFARYLKMSVLGDLIWGDKKIWTEGNFNPASKANTVDVTNALALKANTADVLASAAMTANGRLVIPTSSGVLYIQWYEGPLAGAETVAYPAISHPVPFPNECLFAGPFTRSTSSSTLSDQMFQMEYWDRLGVKIFPQWFGTGNQSLVKPLIIAIGR